MSGETKAASTKGRLLVVDDDAIIQMALTDVLESAGFEVVTASDGKAAIEKLRTSRFDLVLMDCMMPEMDGFEAAGAIRSGETPGLDPGVPIIALTGMGTDDDMEACLAAGMNARVKKPPESDELIAAIAAWLSNADAGGERSAGAAGTAGIEFVDRLANRFMQEIPHTIERLQAAVDGEDVGALRFLGHQLAGSTGAIGARSLARHARALEDTARDGSRDKSLQQAACLITELRRLNESAGED